MLTVTLDEARARLTELIEAAVCGETVTITHDGTPIAELNPARPEPGIDQRSVGEALRDLDALQDDPDRPRVSVEEILAWRDEGRR